MRIKTTEDCDRLWENLCEATGENARSKALDRAARYYLRMCGGVAADGRGIRRGDGLIINDGECTI
jgi:hypothetical protein